MNQYQKVVWKSIKIEVSIIISFANKIIRTRYLKKEEMKFWLCREINTSKFDKMDFFKGVHLLHNMCFDWNNIWSCFQKPPVEFIKLETWVATKQI